MLRSFLMLRSYLLLPVLLLTVCWGCARSRTVTISTIPADATIRIDGRDRGRGPITETFSFGGGVENHTVVADREGYRPQRESVSADFARESLVISLKPEKRRVTFNVGPMPATLKLDGKSLSSTRVSDKAVDIEFEIGPSGKWNTHRVRAERDEFLPIEREIKFEDTETVYDLVMPPLRKSIQIVTTPPGAEIFIDNTPVGKSPLARSDVAFPVDIETGEFASQKLRVEHPGFAPKEIQLSWDAGKTNYEIPLEPLKKTVRIVTNPPGATIVVGEVELKPDADGAVSVPLEFDLDEKGNLKTYRGTATKKKTADSEWETAKFDIAWEDGKTDYTIPLKEILVRRVTLLRVETTRTESSWTISGKTIPTMATKDVTEGSDKNKPTKITFLKKGTVIDTLAVAPDGASVVFTTLSDAGGELKSLIQVQPTEGTPDVKLLSDGRSLEIMPSYTPDGSQIVFASNRAGRKLSIWSMSVMGPAAPEELTGRNGDSNDLWPTVDSNPKPRLFYQSLFDMRTDPRLFSTPFGGTNRKDLTAAAGGMQPRVAPTADAVVFTAADPKTGKRDIYRMSDGGQDAVNLTNTPTVDEFDPAWSADATKIAYVSARNPESPDNLDITVIDSSGGGKPTVVTSNSSWDDCPAWDPNSNAIYFRSNRGGDWNIWRIDLK
jgi:hypothetical protein